MSQERASQTSDLSEQMTLRGAFEAIVFGTTTEEGRKFIELYGKLRESEGDTVEWKKGGGIKIQPAKK